MANYVTEKVKFSYTINPGKYGLDASGYQITEISPEGNNPVSQSGKIISRTEILEPNKVKVIEFAPLK
jgi:hypothetical protein